jgi:hypothetical protein
LVKTTGIKANAAALKLYGLDFTAVIRTKLITAKDTFIRVNLDFSQIKHWFTRN